MCRDDRSQGKTFITRPYESTLKDKWLLLTLTATFIFISINLWLAIVSIFLLRNGGIEDASNIDQALSSTVISHLFFYGYAQSNFFEVHPVFFFFAILPFYSIMPNFISSYLIEYIVVFSAAVPLYFISKDTTGYGKYSFLIALSYLFYPGFFTSDGLEEVTFFIGLAVYAIYFYHYKRKGPFLISFVLMLTTIEFVPIIGVFFSLYILLKENILGKIKLLQLKQIKFGEFTHSFLGFFFVTSLILSISFYLVDSNAAYYFSGGTHDITTSIVGTNFFSGSNLFRGLQVDTFTKSINLLFYNAPYMFLSILDPIFLLQVPWFLVTLVSSNPIYYTAPVYYGAFLAASVPIGFVYGLKKITENVDKTRKKAIIKKIVVATLVINILVFGQVGAAQYYYDTSTSSITPQDQGVFLLSQLLKSGQSVNSGPDEMPIVGLYDWNDTFYGTPTNFLMFKNQTPYTISGFPISLADYGFYAAAGQYVLYERNYTSKPVFNYYNYSNDVRASEYTNLSFFSPPGNYTLSLGFSHINYLRSVMTGVDSGRNYSLSLGKAIAIPFKVNHSGVLKAVATTSNYGGIWYLSGMVTSTIEPTEIVSGSGADYPFQYFRMNNISIEANKTYYFWYIPQIFQAANYGTSNLPISTTKGISYLGAVTNLGISDITILNFSVPITLLFESNSTKKVPIVVNVDGIKMNGTMGENLNALLPANISTSGQISVSVHMNSSDYLSYYGTNISVLYYHQRDVPKVFLLNYPVVLLATILAIGVVLIALIWVVNNQIPKKFVFRITNGLTLITFIAFWTFFGLSWTLIPSLYSFTLFKLLGIIMAVSFMLVILTYDWN